MLVISTLKKLNFSWSSFVIDWKINPDNTHTSPQRFDFYDFTGPHTELPLKTSCYYGLFCQLGEFVNTEQTAEQKACAKCWGDSSANSGLLSCVVIRSRALSWPPPYQGLNLWLLTANSVCYFRYLCLMKKHGCGCRTCNIFKFLFLRSTQLFLQAAQYAYVHLKPH